MGSKKALISITRKKGKNTKGSKPLTEVAAKIGRKKKKKKKELIESEVVRRGGLPLKKKRRDVPQEVFFPKRKRRGE